MSRTGFISRLTAPFRGRGQRVSPESLPVEGAMPEFSGVAGWLNTEPLTKAALAGKVVLSDFWTYSCINCIRTIPHLKRWHDAYRDRGLVIVGVHTPEFPFEKIPANVEAAVRRFGIAYPVALDPDYRLWNAYRNRYWPAHYFVDARGNIRYHHFGEGAYDHSEAVIRALLRDAGTLPEGVWAPVAPPSETDFQGIGTPETYLGWQRLEYLGSPESVRPGAAQHYSAIKDPTLNVFYFGGVWEIRDDCAEPREAGARIIYKVKAAKVNLVMEGKPTGSAVEVRLDGAPLPREKAGADVAVGPDGSATVTVREGRLYELVDLHGEYRDHTVELIFKEPGIKAFAFTFG